MKTAHVSIIGVVVVAALFAGCRAKTVVEPPPATELAPIAPAAYEAPSDSAPREFTIVLTTFIPANHVLGPAVHPQAYVGVKPKRLVFSGDDRGFDPLAARFRARQVVTVVPDVALDPDGLREGSKQNLGGLTESFVADEALADGKLDDRDRDATLGDAHLKHAETAVDVGGLIIDDPVRLGPKTVSVRLRTSALGGPRDQLIVGAPSIDWHLTLTIDCTAQPVCKVAGTWDGYPALEIYVNGTPVYQATPGNKPASFTDLLKLLPGNADVKVDENVAL